VWLDLLKNHNNKKTILTSFCKNYYYFSLHQIRAFSRIIKLLPADDSQSLSMLASVIHDEFGNGLPEKAHSNLFKKFALSVDQGLRLPTEEGQIVFGVRKYVNDLWDSFDGDSLPKALAAYVFLEKSAVAFYPKILNILNSYPDVSNDLEFFHLHATLEVEHEKAAHELVTQQKFSLVNQLAFEAQLEYLKRSWEEFWHDIFIDSHKTLEMEAQSV
jgi:pyrroloquinoline quinone (PQQ) biosynthesis protein C